MAVYSHRVKINPLGQLTVGTVGWDGDYSLSGYGLSTFGFIWGIADIWTDWDFCEDVTWEDCACAEDCD